MTARTEDRADWIDMRADALFAEYQGDAEKIAEAREHIAGSFDAPFYPELEAALDRMHDKDPDELTGSDVATDLYRWADTYRAARDARLRDMAEADAEDEWEQLGYDNAEARAWDRDAA